MNSGKKRLTRKVRDTLKEIQILKHEKKWHQASTLAWKLRKSWWGRNLFLENARKSSNPKN